MNNEQISVIQRPDSESIETLVTATPMPSMESIWADPSLLERSSVEHLIEICNKVSKDAANMVEVEFTSRRMALRCAWMVGSGLILLKPKIGHGKWLKWLGDNLPNISEDSVHRYMKLAKQFPSLEAISNYSLQHQPLEIEVTANRAPDKKAGNTRQARPAGWEAVKIKAEQLTALIKKTDGQPSDRAYQGVFQELQSALTDIGKPRFTPPPIKGAVVKLK